MRSRWRRTAAPSGWPTRRRTSSASRAGVEGVNVGSRTCSPPQEERVAALAATGATNKQIADQLYLSTSTIETHLEHIYAKLGIHSRRELMAMRAVSAGNE